MMILRYTLLRVLVFAVVAALFWLVGFRGFLLALVALLVSGIVSIFVLRGSRDRMSVALDRRMSETKRRMAERTDAEDAWNEAQQGRPVRADSESGYSDDMAQDRRTKETPTPGEDPREIDRERTTDQALDETAAQEGLVHPQQPTGATGASTDAPGRDLGDLDDAPEVEKNRHIS